MKGAFGTDRANDAADEPTELRAAPTPRLFNIRLVMLHDTLRRSATMAYRREFGLTGVEWKIVAKVGDIGALSLSELAEMLVADTGQISRAVKAMVARGLLESRRRSGGPGIVISLSRPGIEMHRRMVEIAIERNNALVGDISPDEVERTIEVMEVLRVRAQALLEQELKMRPAARNAVERRKPKRAK